MKTIVGTPVSASSIVLGSLPGSLNAPAYLAVMPGNDVTLVVSSGSEEAILQIAVP